MTVIPLGTQKQQDVPPGKERGVHPPRVLWKGEQQTEGQRQVPKEWQDTRCHFGWPRHACGRRAPSWQQDTVGGPGLAWAGDTQGLSPGVGRDRGAGIHKVPWQGHFIPPRTSSSGVQHPNLSSADAALGPHHPHVAAHGSASACKGASSILPPPSFLGACACLLFFWHKPLAPWPSQALQAPLKGSMCLGTDWESWKYHQGCKKNPKKQHTTSWKI